VTFITWKQPQVREFLPTTFVVQVEQSV